MTNEKASGSNEGGFLDSEGAPRARNRTVMLSPEMTGAVRARIASGLGHARQGGGNFQGAQTPASIHQGDRRPGGRENPSAFTLPESESVPVREEPLPASNFSVVAPTVREDFGPAVPPSASNVELTSIAGDSIRYQRLSTIVGFLVSYDKDQNGEVFELRCGRLVITSDRSTSGNVLFIDDETVSPSHAVIRVSPDGDIQVLDQLSEFGTQVQQLGGDKTVELSGVKASLGHGDTLLLGKRRFHVALVVRGGSET